jgi:hypothetical protein
MGMVVLVAQILSMTSFGIFIVCVGGSRTV